MSTELYAWLDEYNDSHINPINILIHKVAVPVILFTVVGFLWALPIPSGRFRHLLSVGKVGLVNMAALAIIGLLAFYFRLSTKIGMGMALVFVVMMGILTNMELKNVKIFRLCIILFIVAWIFQFIGHEIEGKKPAFFKDLQFLLIGPIWTLAGLYRTVGIKY
ncbi:unnamed protein product [Didymodactylos carnosus]|uniref:DUF962 domain-containing protein n=2 Tax=Didymodactylos carnosus TaxID=1234261 RepID=A0A815GAE6_9BILA|nr:unnamed protein product [Didymodactylos carnosus]CAF4194905.1 unnamed protein product [Didymodactylos carnosus]